MLVGLGCAGTLGRTWWIESFALSLRARGMDIRIMEAVVGHSDGETTMGFLHALNQGAQGVPSSLDDVL
jgi:hypothetical protein